MSLEFVANGIRRANRNVGASVVSTDEVAVKKDEYMKSLQGLK
jgi:hypothetical protein